MTTPADHLGPNLTLAAIAATIPGAIPVLEDFGLDYCCKGDRRLAEAAAAKGLDTDAVLRRLRGAAAETETAGQDVSIWSDATLIGLVEHILQRYHDRLRQDLPRLAGMGERVVAAHGQRHPEVHEVAGTLGGLRAELESHMFKEEHVLFPFITQLERGLGHEHPMLGHVASPIAVMEQEHDAAGAALTALRSITSNFVAPGDACATFRAFYEGLATLERELHEHIHLENNVLFPRARALEERVIAGV
jgi:regulator of cell morphogenesis and NO signaling